jgi:hypothetical protein
MDQSFGAAQVSGFISTDGTIGALTVGNVTDWSLLLNDGSTTKTLTGPLSGNNSGLTLLGSDLTATATGLFYNFSQTTNNHVVFANFTGGQLYSLCFEGATGNCDGIPSAIGLSLPYPVVSAIPEQGIVEIASTTPLPAALPLLAGGLGVIGLLARRRKRKASWSSAIAA